ncbi:putative olfactory receptor 56B2 [Ornithorhynchus anatinus]|nr:putative olfactory receptor 56B2 [Ornithorhynchus anatinus]
MFLSIGASNGSSPQVAEFILMGFPGIHSWQHWLSLPLALLYLSALVANVMILLTIWKETVLHQPMFYFLAVLALVDMGLSTTIMPRILAMLWFNAHTISLPECFIQIYAIHIFVGLESGIFLCMAIDRYVAICHPLRYPSIITEGFVLKITLFMVFRNGLLVVPVPVLASDRIYCSRNEIDHCLCSNLGVTSLACDDRKANSIFQLSVAWILMGSDVGLIILSYALILRAVLKLHSAEAASKALSTCSSHIILILFFYTVIVVMSITHSTKGKVPLIPVLLNVLHNVIPPALNPIVYALRTQEINVGILKLIRLTETFPAQKVISNSLGLKQKLGPQSTIIPTWMVWKLYVELGFTTPGALRKRDLNFNAVGTTDVM